MLKKNQRRNFGKGAAKLKEKSREVYFGKFEDPEWDAAAKRSVAHYYRQSVPSGGVRIKLYTPEIASLVEKRTGVKNTLINYLPKTQKGERRHGKKKFVDRSYRPYVYSNRFYDTFDEEY